MRKSRLSTSSVAMIPTIAVGIGDRIGERRQREPIGRDARQRAERLLRGAERRRVRRGAGEDAEHGRAIEPRKPARERRARPRRASTIAAASAFSFIPCWRSAAKKPGPSCSPIVKTNRISPNSFTKSSVS